MNITISTDANDLNQALSGFDPPLDCELLTVSAPNASKAVNLFLGSPLDCRVVFQLPDRPVNLAGMLSLCSRLQQQPAIEGNCTATSLAAAFKGNSSCRYSMHWLAPRTTGCRDYRQMFWGATAFSGNGVQAFDYGSVQSPHGMRNFFGGGSGIRTEYYDSLLLALHGAMLAGTLPTPMSPVDFGDSVSSPYVEQVKQDLIDYGWAIKDAGQKPDQRNWLERELCDGFDSMLPDWERRVDTSCVATTSQGGILFTSRHVLYCDHWAPSPGKLVRFRSGETRNITRVVRNSGWDLSIAELDSPVEASPAPLLPIDGVADMPLALGPPAQYLRGQSPAVVFFNRNNHASVCDLSWIHRDEIACQFTQPASPKRQELFIPISTGDSGSPLCCVYQSQLVLLGVVTHPGTARFLTDPVVRQWMTEVASPEKMRVIEFR